MNDDSSLNNGIWAGLDEISIISRGEEEDDDESPMKCSRRVFWGSTARTLLPQFETADVNKEGKKIEEERVVTPTNKEITYGQENAPTKKKGKKRKRRKARNKARNKAKSKVSTPSTA